MKLQFPTDGGLPLLSSSRLHINQTFKAKKELLLQSHPSGFLFLTPDDVASLFEADFLHGGKHPLSLGLTAEIAWLKKQERLTFARVGITDPVSLDDYIAHDGYRGLHNALKLSAAEIVKQVTDSGLRGRGGAAFPTGIKWNTVLNAPAEQKYIVCNADEGDSGTYSDRMIMEGDPYVLIEGMTIAGLAIAAPWNDSWLRTDEGTFLA